MNEKISIIDSYGDNLTKKEYITNPAIAREEEIKDVLLILLSAEKSAIIIGEPGTGKTALVEGISYMIQNNNVPDALKGYEVINLNAPSMVGTINRNGETVLKFQVLIDELKEKEKIILFIDEIHTLVGEEALDFANMIKPIVSRGSIKVIGATTINEYEAFILKDKAFVRRFTKVELGEPDAATTEKILFGTIKKIETKTNTVLPYSDFLKKRIIEYIVDYTKECNREYGLGSRWPDIALNILNMAHATALYDNSHEVRMKHIYKAVTETNKIYKDIRIKAANSFKLTFSKQIEEELK